MELFLACQGTLLFTGVGKSGHIAEKIATTILSTGTRALYLPPTNAMHGDVGIVQEKDLLIVLSKSGESEELINLLTAVKSRGIQTIVWTSNRESRLAKECDLLCYLPLDEELCPFNLAPTTSSLLQLLLGDALAVALMEEKKFTLSDYAMNHPAGRIGRRITTHVSDVMIQGERLPLCKPTDKVRDILLELSSKRCGCVLVADEEEKITGIFTDGDLRRALQTYGDTILQAPVSEVMVKTFRSIAGDKLIVEAIEEMESDPQKRIMMLPVLKENKLVGLLHLHDVIQSGL
ncbi:MAG: KpsF/GutQ family sugar-phosphate isomerase [Candidatus Algichlamydia australiensis]|nr:KpsF/GutQ family sugar-phosphate isomerase [Chlamydiales bacterium]